MGIDSNGVRFLAHARSTGVDFVRTVTIGRQSLYVRSAAMRQILGEYGQDPGDALSAEICEGSGGFSDALLRYLGASEAHSLDYSGYEGATHTHDMNQPIPGQFKARYSAVLDGGSLEHVFNFPTAIRNCMEMVEPGGHYLAITPANNFFGHGFYQFSPELYFSVLSPENGFEVVSMIAFEERRGSVWYRVANPRDVGGRVTLANHHPVYLLIIAKRTAVVPIFGQTPQQSDYRVMWGEHVRANAAGEVPASRPWVVTLVKVLLPAALRRWLRGLQQRRLRRKLPTFDPRHFRRMT